MSEVTIGDKKLIYRTSFMVADGIDVKLEIPNPHDPLPMTLRFVASDKIDQTANWSTDDGRLVIVFTGWNNSLGTGFPEPQRIGEMDGEPLAFQIFNHYLPGGTNLVHFYLLQGGKYE